MSHRRRRQFLFRLLLRIYPAGFRQAHGAGMAELFHLRRARARGMFAVAALWGRLIGDAIATSWSLRRAARRRSRGAGGIDMWRHDGRYAVRQLLRTPGFTIGAVALLAVGIGANIAVFTVVDAFLIRPVPYARPDQVVHIYQDEDDGDPGSVAFPAYRAMVASPVFSAVSASAPAQVLWDRQDGPIEVSIEFATASYLTVAGRAPHRGRWFGPEHDSVGAGAAAVVSAPAWQSRFGGDPDIVGKTVRLNGHAVTIIGVGPAALGGSFDPVVTDFWLSISSVFIRGSAWVSNLDRREDHWYQVRARLVNGVSPEMAQQAMNALAARLAAENPAIDHGRDLTVRRARDVSAFPESRNALTLATAIVVLLLVLTGANLANLLLVRGIARSGEVAVRRALGAGAGRIGRLFLIESLILSIAGGVAGIVLADFALAALPLAPLPPPFSTALNLTIDVRVAAFAIVLMVGTGVLFGLAPAVRSGPADIAATLRDDRRTTSLSHATMRLRNALIVIQVAGSVVLILAAGLLARTVIELQRIDPAVDAARVAYVRPDVTPSSSSGASVPLPIEEMRLRIASLPGVTHAAAAIRLPAQRSGTTSTIIEDYVPAAGGHEIEVHSMNVSPEYFDTMGLHVIEGRPFTRGDVAGNDRVVLVNQAAAARFWPGRSAIGGRMRSTARNAPMRTVVGVVENAPVVAFPEVPARPMFYVTSTQSPLATGYILARTDGDPTALVNAMRASVMATGGNVRIQSQGTLASHFGAALSLPRFLATVMSAVSMLSILLAAMGIYAVVAFTVARRAGEMGIRLALGATAGRLVRMVIGETVATVGAGLVAGIALAAVLVPRLEALLFGLEPLDPLTVAGSVAVLVAVAWLAAYLPARAVARANPASALRD